MEQLLSAVGQMYDAALEPALWVPALQGLGDYLETARTMLVMEDAAHPEASTFYSSVDDPDWHRRYAEQFMLINPARIATLGRVREGDTVLTTDFMTPSEYRETRFYKEFLSDRGITDLAAVTIEKTATRVTALSAQRSEAQGFADEILREKLRRILPHAQRAVKIARALEHRSVAASGLAETLDALRAPVFLLSASGRVVHSNAQGAHFLAEDDLTRGSKTALTLTEPSAMQELVRALAVAARGDIALDAAGHAIPARAPSGRQFILTVMPLTSGRREAIGSPFAAVAAVSLKEAEFDVPSSLSALAALHGLTPRETNVLVAVVERGTVAGVSPVLGINVSTVRTHLKAIFRKTGATSQADLVKLVAGAIGPFG